MTMILGGLVRIIAGVGAFVFCALIVIPALVALITTFVVNMFGIGNKVLQQHEEKMAAG